MLGWPTKAQPQKPMSGHNCIIPNTVCKSSLEPLKNKSLLVQRGIRVYFHHLKIGKLASDVEAIFELGSG